MKLRIISGDLKGRLINVPKSDLIRPTTDKVRETLFNILNNKISLAGIKALDLYSGSGSFGLECFSRGAEEIHFVEKNPAIYKTLEKNISSLNANDNCTVYKTTALKFSLLNSNCNYNLIFADPPFFKDDIYAVVENILANRFLDENGIMIIERSKQTKEKDIENFKVDPFKITGDNCLYEISYSISPVYSDQS